MHRMKRVMGMTGRRGWYTNGEAYWMGGLAWVSGFLMGVAAVAVVQKYGWM